MRRCCASSSCIPWWSWAGLWKSGAKRISVGWNRGLPPVSRIALPSRITVGRSLLRRGLTGRRSCVTTWGTNLWAPVTFPRTTPWPSSLSTGEC